MLGKKDEFKNISEDYDDSDSSYRNYDIDSSNNNKTTKISVNGIVSTAKNISDGAVHGAKVGSTFPVVGTKIGAVIGGILGGLFKK